MATMSETPGKAIVNTTKIAEWTWTGGLEGFQISQIFPPQTFVVKPEDMPRWFEKYGSCVHPETGAPCNIDYVLWADKRLGGKTFAHYHWYHAKDGTALSINITAGADRFGSRVLTIDRNPAPVEVAR